MSEVKNHTVIDEDDGSMLKLIRKMLRDETGPTAIEYGLIAVVIAVAIIAGLTRVGSSLNAAENRIATTIAS